MRAANIVTAIAIIPWICLILMGRDLTYDIYTHGIGIFPNDGQIDFYLLLPFGMALMLALCGWIANIVQKLAPVLAAISCLSFFALFPYLILYSGGM